MNGGMASQRRRRRLVADLTPLRVSPQYRLLLGTQLAGMLGANFTAVAVPYQIWVLTHSSLLVGMAGLVQAVPLIGGMLAGGALADAHDRRLLLLASRLLLAVVGVGLALNGPRSCCCWRCGRCVPAQAGDGPALGRSWRGCGSSARTRWCLACC